MKLVSRAQMNKIDANASEVYKIPSIVLMEHAAHEMYLDIIKNQTKKTSFLIVCGSGNNGGDGFALARLLFLQGYSCDLLFIGHEDKMSEDTLRNYLICKALKIAVLSDISSFEKYDVIVDGLFGTGLCRTVEGVYAQWIERINASKKEIISIDIPSGIDCDNAKVLGCAIKANITYTMQCGKNGLYVYPGREYAGKVKVLNIFIPQELVDGCESQTYLIEKEVMKTFLPERKMHSNKGSYGKVLCIGGSDGMSGAISLAARSALCAGCGLLTCAVPQSIQNAVQTNVQESMSLLLKEEEGHISKSAISLLTSKMSAFDIILCGCGIGRSEDIKDIVSMLYQEDKNLVIDADGLFALQGSLSNRKNTILTPHLKEFATLMNVDVKEVVENTFHYIDVFTTQYPDITLVLKSETTIIAQGQTRYINTYGNNGLATGGSGDVLAGLITGLYAQTKNSLQAAVLGVFIHAYGADEINKEKSVYSLLPSDVIEQIEKVLFELTN